MVKPYFKDRLGRGLLVGTQIVLSDSISAEMIGRAGFDFALIDVDGVESSLASLRAAISSLAATDTAAFARLSATETEYDMRTLRQALVLAPDGVILTGINNAKSARAAISECLLPPCGVRRVKPHMAIGRGGVIGGDLTIDDASSTAVIIQLDSAEALRNIEELATLDGVDGFIFDIGLFCAPNGRPQNIFGADTEELIGYAASYLKASGLAFGAAICRSGSSAAGYWRELGASFIVSGTDAEYVLEGAKRNLTEFKGFNEYA